MRLNLDKRLCGCTAPPFLIKATIKWFPVATTTLLVFLLVNLVLLAVQPRLFLQIPTENLDLGATPVSAHALTSTPFQPLTPTRALSTPVDTILPPTETTVPPTPTPPYDFYGINFHPGAEAIKLGIKPGTALLNRNQPIVLTINPGRNCPYEEDGRACVRSFSTAGGGEVIFVSVHSGIAGGAEPFRRAVEGFGIDQAGYSLKQIRSNLTALTGAPVQLRQAERLVDGLQLAVVGRVPSRLVQMYFQNPVEQALSIAAGVAPELETFVNTSSPILVFETCGWTVPGEAWAPGVTSFSSSVYIAVIQLAP